MPSLKTHQPTNTRPRPPTERETMARVLEGKHGTHAADVAEFFASVHRELGDETRANAWTGVAMVVRARETARVTI